MDRVEAKRSLGQNFLRSERALREIVDAAALQPLDTVLEIGPGEGVLTERLLASGARVIAVEKDDRLIAPLSRRFADAVAQGTLVLLHGDILDDTRGGIQERLAALLVSNPFVLVANIPYYITGMIFRMFLETGPYPRRMVLLVQKEVAERVVSRNGKETILSLSVKAFGIPRVVARVPRGAFVPAPNVDSAILAIDAISHNSFRDAGITTEDFFRVVRAGFAAKRKVLRNTLVDGLGYPKEAIAGVFERLGFSPSVRAEDLPLPLWFALVQALSSLE